MRTPPHRRTSAHGAGSSPAVDALRYLADVVQRRLRGESLPGLPDWIAPDCIESLWAPLAGAPEHGLCIAVRDGVPAHAVPSQVVWGGVPVKLRPRRAPRAIGQAAPSIVRSQGLRVRGTVACVVADSLNPARRYALTCGHVAAPDDRCHAGDELSIADALATRDGYLVEWQPALGEGAFPTTIDAALVEIHTADAHEMQDLADFLPEDVGDGPSAEQRVTLRRADGPSAGQLKVFWSGYVDLPEVSPGYPDYFFQGAVGYALGERSRAGDSGAAVWDEARRLMGMHIGALPDAADGEANAILGPIAPILDWFKVQPLLRGGGVASPVAAVPVSVDARRAPVAPDPAKTTADEEVTVVAQTLWGEARGEGERGMCAVAGVIANRLRTRYRGKSTATQVCLDPFQFSCWLPADPNHARLLAVPRAPDAAYMTACGIARELCAGTLADITLGARHYYDTSLPRPPSWALGHEPCCRIGAFLLFNDVA